MGMLNTSCVAMVAGLLIESRAMQKLKKKNNKVPLLIQFIVYAHDLLKQNALPMNTSIRFFCFLVY